MTSRKSSFIFYFFLVLILGGLLTIFLTPAYTDMCSQGLLACLKETESKEGLGKMGSNFGCVLSNFGCVIRSFFGSLF